MTSSEFQVWRDVHATLFDMNRPEDAGLLAAIAEAFQDKPLATLVNASRRYASDSDAKVSRFRADQLSSLGRYVRAIEAEERRETMATSLNPDRGECVRCHNSGTLTVPHPKSIELVQVNGDGECRWRWKGTRYTNLAFCACALGRTKFNAVSNLIADRTPGKVCLFIEDYERDISRQDWEWLMGEAERERKAEDGYRYRAAKVDNVFGPLVLKLTQGK